MVSCRYVMFCNCFVEFGFVVVLSCIVMLCLAVVSCCLAVLCLVWYGIGIGYELFCSVRLCNCIEWKRSVR